MKSVSCEEGAAIALEGRDVEFLRQLIGGWLEQRSGGWAITRVVGHVRLPSGTVLRIRSRKAPSAVLLAWLAYADPMLRALRAVGRIPDALGEGDFFALLARLLVDELRRVVEATGLVRRYHRVTVTTSVVRGAIDFGSLSRRGGDLSRTPCVVWERRPSTTLNRLLAAALDRIARDPILRAAAGARLAPLREAFASVPAIVSVDALRRELPLGRDEAPFELCAALARTVLCSIGVGAGDALAAAGHLVNLEALFERTVVVALREAGIAVQSKVPLRYDRMNVDGATTAAGSMQIDAYCPDVGGGALVIDAKFKTSVSSANLQQAVTYCFATGARRAALVFPAREGLDRRAFVVSAPTGERVCVYPVPLLTDGRNVAEWRTRAKQLTDELRSLPI